MATKFDELIKKAEMSGTLNLKSQESLTWLKNRAGRMTNMTLSNFQGREKFAPVSGSMYLFRYNPKTRETLPYYDTFPLVIPVRLLDDGFNGLNLHYLPPMMRAKLLEALMDNYMSKEKQRLAINYQLLRKASQLKLFEPCFKRYLSHYVYSQMYGIQPEEWPAVIFLPLQKFQKKTAQQVWAESRKQVGW